MVSMRWFTCDLWYVPPLPLGGIVCAWQTVDFQVDESSFTGETEPAHKQPATLDVQDVQTVSSRTNMAFMGTLACGGRAKVSIAMVILAKLPESPSNWLLSDQNYR